MSKIDTSKWTPEQRAAYEAATAAVDTERAAAEQEKAKRDAEQSSPEALIEAAKEQAEQARAEREKAARDAADDAAFKAAVKAHGGAHRVARVRTFEGSIIMHAVDKATWDEFCERLEGYQSDEDKMKLSRAITLDSIDHPSRARAAEWIDRYPNLWVPLFGARDYLVYGLEQEAKKGA